MTIRDVMTTDVTCVELTSTVVDAARLMKQRNIGDVLVADSGKVCGIVTDRDIVIRAVADGCDPATMMVADICSQDLATLDPTASVEEAKKLMADRAVRRVPVMQNGKPVGIISLGDVAIEGSGERPLEEISAAPPNR